MKTIHSHYLIKTHPALLSRRCRFLFLKFNLSPIFVIIQNILNCDTLKDLIIRMWILRSCCQYSLYENYLSCSIGSSLFIYIIFCFFKYYYSQLIYNINFLFIFNIFNSTV